MKHQRCDRSTAAALVIALVAGLASGNGSRAQAVHFDHLTVADGLPGREVLSLHQDSLGFIWIGTTTGLARYEGTRFRTWFHDRKVPNSLSNDQVNEITSDREGRVWIATAGGYCRYDAEHNTFTRYRIEADSAERGTANRINNLLFQGRDTLWIRTENGLYRQQISSGNTELISVEGAAGSSLPGKVAVNCMVIDRQRNGVWFGTLKGLAFWDQRSQRFIDHRNAPAHWAFLTPQFSGPFVLDGADSAWYFTMKPYSFAHVDLTTGASQHFTEVEGIPIDYGSQWMASDGNGGVWFSSWKSGLYHCPRGGVWTRVERDEHDPTSLANGNVKAMCPVDGGDIWFGHQAGISILRKDRSWFTLFPVGGKPGSMAEELFEWNDTLLIVGTDGDGVRLLDPRDGSSESVHFRDTVGMRLGSGYWNNYVNGICQRNQGSLWLNSIGGPSKVFDLSDRSIRAADELYRDTTKWLFGRIAFTVDDGEGSLWCGTWGKGLRRVDLATGAFETYSSTADPAHRLPNDRLLSFLRTNAGDVWLGMNDGGGLVQLGRNGAAPRFHFDDGAEDSGLGVVRCMAESPDGSIWIGTHEGGLDVHDPRDGSFRAYTRKDGLPGDRIVGICFSTEGIPVVSSFQGIAIRPPGSAGFMRLPLPAGLEDHEVAAGLCALADGRVAVGVGERILLFDPNVAAMAGRIPQAVITSVIAHGGEQWSFDPSSALQLPHDDRGITIELGALHADHANDLFFAYRVADLDTTWNHLGNAQRVDLNALPPGSHRVEVRASSNGADWSERPAVLLAEVLPPFWNTWWFRMIATVMIVVLALLGGRFYVRERLREQREHLEREQAVLSERMRIAGDMHDDLGAGLSGLKLRSEMALRMEKDPLKREQLGTLANTAGDLIGSMRQIIWTMNADQTGVEDLVVYTTSYARTYCAENNLVIEVRTDDTWPPLSLSTEQRRNIFLVVKEALHNVVKHAAAYRVALTMRWSGSLQVEIIDDGIGLMSGAETGEGNGMRNMRKRVEVLGGAFDMQGGNGTTLRFSVPLNQGTNERSIAQPRIG